MTARTAGTTPVGWALRLVGAWGVALAVNRSLVRVSGPSMLPALHPGDLLVTVPVRGGAVRAGDVVVVDPPTGPRSVKRVVATAGQQVTRADAVLQVDGRALGPRTAPGEDGAGGVDAGASGTWVVAPGQVFLLGDHAAASTDSRTWGPVPSRRVRRRVLAVLAPVPRLVRRWSRQPGRRNTTRTSGSSSASTSAS